MIVGAGILVQCTLLVFPDLWSFRGIRNYAFAFAIGLFGLLPGRQEHEYHFDIHLLAYFVVVAGATFWLFRDRLMPRVSETGVFVRSLVFWYLLLSVQLSDVSPAIWIAAAVPTIVTLVVAFAVREWTFRTRFFVYIWFIVVTVAIGLLFLHMSDLSYLMRAANYQTTASPLDLFMTGMALTYLAGSAAYLYQLWPPLRQKDRGRYSDWQLHADDAMRRFADYQMKPGDVAGITGWIVAVFVLNAISHVLPAPTLGAIVVVVAPYVIGFLLEGSMEPNGVLFVPTKPSARPRKPSRRISRPPAL